MTSYSLYIHTNKINGKRYVGITSSTDPEKRWKNGKNYKRQRFGNAITKYGWDNFTHEVLLTGLTKEEAQEREKFYISLFRTTDDKYGYNISVGGESNERGKDAYSHEYMKQWYKEHPEYEKTYKSSEKMVTYRKNYMKNYYEKHKTELKERNHKRYLEIKNDPVRNEKLLEQVRLAMKKYHSKKLIDNETI